MERMSKVHIWIGYTQQSQKEFNLYFDQKNAFLFDQNGNEKDPSQIILSQFSQDVGMAHSFNEDFLNLYYNSESDDLNIVLQELSDIVSPERAKDICHEKGITKANAMFFYTDAELIILNPDKKYNGLTYIGSFNWDY